MFWWVFLHISKQLGKATFFNGKTYKCTINANKEGKASLLKMKNNIIIYPIFYANYYPKYLKVQYNPLLFLSCRLMTQIHFVFVYIFMLIHF